MDLFEPMKNKQYRLGRELGRGATATVYLASADGVGEFALKVLHPSLAKEEEFRRRANSEFKMVSSLDHPGIVKVYGLLPESKSNSVGIAMEYVEGASLSEIQNRLPYVLPEAGALLLLDVLSALEHAHSKGVIHRDLKPSNILVSKIGKVFVTDFGLAKMTDLTSATATGAVLGSPDYMSPEQARGESVTPASDLFSAGAILYFLVTGTRPFHRSSVLATLAAVSQADCEAVQRRNPKVSPLLSKIIHKALARNSRDRFITASDFRNALHDYLEQSGLLKAAHSFSDWYLRAPDSTMDGLKAIAETLSGRAEQLVYESKKGDHQKILEVLNHLGIVAPESEKLQHLLDALEEPKNRERKIWLWGGLIILILSGVIFFGFQFLNPKMGPANLVSTLSVPQVKINDEFFPSAGSAEVPIKVKEKVKLNVNPQKISAVRKTKVRFNIPPDVEVQWDGAKINARNGLMATPGYHNLTLEKRGYPAIRQRILVSPNEPTVIQVE